MNYIWEVLLKVQDLGINTKEIDFQRAANPSPYVEVALDDLNPAGLEKKVDINPYYRYSSIFQGLTEGGLKDYPELEETLFDILIHFLGEWDVLQGLSKKEYYGLFLYEDMQKNCYEKAYKDILKVFSRKQRNILLENMVKLHSIGPSIELLRILLGRLYPSSLLYLDTVDRKTLLIYIGKKETAQLKKQVQFILDLFIPIDYTTKLFWDIHFGIIDVDATMILDDVMIY